MISSFKKNILLFSTFALFSCSYTLERTKNFDVFEVEKIKQKNLYFELSDRENQIKQLKSKISILKSYNKRFQFNLEAQYKTIDKTSIEKNISNNNSLITKMEQDISRINTEIRVIKRAFDTEKI